MAGQTGKSQDFKCCSELESGNDPRSAQAIGHREEARGWLRQRPCVVFLCLLHVSGLWREKVYSASATYWPLSKVLHTHYFT